VVAIITILLAILTPSLMRVKELAMRSVCASNLHQYGVGIISYQAANKAQIMKIVHQWSNRPYPNYIRYDANANSAWAGEWGVAQIEPYVRSYNMKSQWVGGIANCPAIDVQLMNRFITERNFQQLASQQFLEFQYTYWGRTDIVNAAYIRNNAQKDLTGRMPESATLLMSDILYFDWSDWNQRPTLGAWRYNHGPNGWAFNECTYMPQDIGSAPDISGINRLFGDAHVSWKSKSDFTYLNLMSTPGAYPLGYIGLDSQDSFYY
jgi:hypothetical protein